MTAVVIKVRINGQSEIISNFQAHEVAGRASDLRKIEDLGAILEGSGTTWSSRYRPGTRVVSPSRSTWPS